MRYSVSELSTQLAPLINDVRSHGLYRQLRDIDHLRCFMEQHVFAVWDFMCLLKELQRQVVSTRAPWLPPIDALSAHLVGGILTEEESDIRADGEGYSSHFDLYLDAMVAIGADTTEIDRLILLLRAGRHVSDVLAELDIQVATKMFVLTTFSFFNHGAHELAAAFVYGREAITGVMFAPILAQLKMPCSPEYSQQIASLKYYLARHIELDSDDHYPKALKMLNNLIQGDKQRWHEAYQMAKAALQARLQFLDSINNALPVVVAE